MRFVCGVVVEEVMMEGVETSDVVVMADEILDVPLFLWL